MQSVKEFYIDNLLVKIFTDRKQMGLAAYAHYREKVDIYLKAQQQVRAIFAAARSQSDFLDAMAADDTLDFTRITAFHMDEYMGLGKDAPQNFGNFLTREIYSKRPFGRVENLDSSVSDVGQECDRYEKLLKEAPLDIVSLGIGENGHLAFNDPHEADFLDPRWVRPVTLDNVSRQQQVNDGEFGHIDEVPTTAVTLTIPALLSCKSVVCVVPTLRKAQAVRYTLSGPVSELCPATILRTHQDAALFLDQDASSLLDLL